MKRKRFMHLMGWSAATVMLPADPRQYLPGNLAIKPVEGSWFEFRHHNAAEGKYWDPALTGFSCDQWDRKIREMAGAGIKYLVLLGIALDGKAFYPSSHLPQHAFGCRDPLEAVLSAADRYGIRFFIGNDFFGDWTNVGLMMQDSAIHALRVNAMQEVAERYGRHKSFYGWYFPNETAVDGLFRDYFIRYVNACSEAAVQLTPSAKTLIAPYGTRLVKPDDNYVKQLEQLNVDFIAYQDEVGVGKTRVEESAAFFRNLSVAHRKAGRARLWADVEIFAFEGEIYKSALVPAPPERVIAQLEAVSPYVDKIFIYQYTGLLNEPGTDVFAGHPDSGRLYERLFRKKR